VATVVVDEVQFTPLVTVTSRVLPSLKVAVAVICLFVPIAIWPDAGVIFKLERFAAATVITVLAVGTELADAEIVAFPKPTAEARPVLVTVATLVAEELQVTMPLIFCVVPSSNVPVAVNCCTTARFTVGVAGVMPIETRLALLTFSCAEPAIAPEVAVIVAVPAVSPVASPCKPGELFTLAMLLLEELQVTCEVKFWCVPSLKVPVAVNCWVVSFAICGFAGVTAMEAS